MFSKLRFFTVSISVSTSLFALGSFADEFHHKNMLIGERAAGLGGAFGAISDDPSGIYYNPAGLAFSFESYISLSANAWASSQTVFKNVVTGQDYTLNSSTFVPTFFGFTQALGNTKMGLAIVVPNSDLIDQNDVLANFASDPTTTTVQNYLTRRYFKQDDTYLIGPAVAREIADNLSAGLSLFYSYRINKSIDNQMVAYNVVPDGRYFFKDTYIDFSGKQLTPKLGLQWMPFPKLSIGVSGSMDFDLGGSFKIRTVGTPTGTVAATQIGYVQQTGVFSNDVLRKETSGAYSSSNFFKSTLGMAGFFSKEFLMTGDFDIIYPLNSSAHQFTYNWSLGSEYYVSESFPFRAGVYSNNSSVRLSSLGGEATSTNIIGLTAGFSWVTTGSSFSLSGSYGFGSGLGRITSTGSQNVSVSQIGIYIMGSYQM